LFRYLVPTLLLLVAPVALAQEDQTPVVVTVDIDRFCDGNFLPDAQVSEVHKYARPWAEGRRIVVRYTAEYALVEIVPPASSKTLHDLMGELSMFLGAATEPACPNGAKQIPITTGVKGLNFAPDGTITSPKE
jgi:hypothetical protein